MCFYDLLYTIDKNTKIYIIANLRCPEMLNYSGLNAIEIENKFEKEMTEICSTTTFESYFKIFCITYINEFNGSILINVERNK